MSTLTEAVEQAKRELGADAPSVQLMDRAHAIASASRRVLSVVAVEPSRPLHLVETHPDELHAVLARVKELARLGTGSHFLDTTDAFGRAVTLSGAGRPDDLRTALLELAAQALAWGRDLDELERRALACPCCEGRGSREAVPPGPERIMCRSCNGRGTR